MTCLPSRKFAAFDQQHERCEPCQCRCLKAVMKGCRCNMKFTKISPLQGVLPCKVWREKLSAAGCIDASGLALRHTWASERSMSCQLYWHVLTILTVVWCFIKVRLLVFHFLFFDNFPRIHSFTFILHPRFQCQSCPVASGFWYRVLYPVWICTVCLLEPNIALWTHCVHWILVKLRDMTIPRKPEAIELFNHCLLHKT